MVIIESLCLHLRIEISGGDHVFISEHCFFADGNSTPWNPPAHTHAHTHTNPPPPHTHTHGHAVHEHEKVILHVTT